VCCVDASSSSSSSSSKFKREKIQGDRIGKKKSKEIGLVLYRGRR
jgi:hypothetical protein